MYKKDNVGAGPVSAQSGITLIALVITIIVMLILVAVTITMAVNGGLFEYAGKAVGDTQSAIDAEQDLGSGKIQVDGIWYDSIDDYLAGIQSEDQSGETTGGTNDGPTGGETEEDTPVSETFSEIYTATQNYTDSNGDTATIPAGYAVGTSTGINAVDTGLVIKDANGNEFVWIPITTDLESSYTYDSEFSEPVELSGTWSNSTLTTKPKYDSQEILNELYGENYYTYTEDFKYAEEYVEMVEKVNQYNGFYIGRYETTIDSNGKIGSKYNTPVLTAGTTLFTKEETNYPYRWYGLYFEQKNADVTGNGTDVQTAMIYGVLWDETMQFIRDQKTAGNTIYDVDVYNSSWHGSSNGHTGVVNSAQANPGTTGDVALNIWDLASNAYEFTQEAKSSDLRALRGGNYYNSIKASGRNFNSNPASTSTSSSARLALYIKCY